jgi:hypothetical protein
MQAIFIQNVFEEVYDKVVVPVQEKQIGPTVSLDNTEIRY